MSLCNNAGINLFNDIGEASYDDWDWILGVNLGGVVNGVRTFVPRIKAHGEGGHIVNTASMAAFIASASRRNLLHRQVRRARYVGSAAWRACAAPHRRVGVMSGPGEERHLREREDPSRALIGAGDAHRSGVPGATRQVHEVGMAPEEVGQKVLRAIQRNDFYIFSHPEFKEELRAIFDEALQALPDEPAPPDRLSFEEGRPRRRGRIERHGRSSGDRATRWDRAPPAETPLSTR